MRDLHGLAGASTPAYLTVWNRGGGTLVASRQSSGNSGTIALEYLVTSKASLGVLLAPLFGRLVSPPTQRSRIRTKACVGSGRVLVRRGSNIGYRQKKSLDDVMSFDCKQGRGQDHFPLA